MTEAVARRRALAERGPC